MEKRNMKIYYSPSYCGQRYMKLNNDISFDTQVLETQGLLNQLALYAGIHQEIPAYPVRLADYYAVLKEYDNNHQDNTFHKSIAIDGMSVAKSLLAWRDTLALSGWKGNAVGSERLKTLADIDSMYEDKGLAILLKRVTEEVGKMARGERMVPKIYEAMEICIPCKKDLLPDYILPLMNALEGVVKSVNYSFIDTTAMPKEMEVIEFTQQYQSEAWLSQQEATDYDVWINSDNKRLDNWLHMSGKPVAGSEMRRSNPQVTQMFLLAVQLFQRPLNVNTLLQYLYLPDSPLNWRLTYALTSKIVREGGFCNDSVKACISDFINNNYDVDESKERMLSKEEREENCKKYLPFDLTDDESCKELATETDAVDIKKVRAFLEEIRKYAMTHANGIAAMKPYDLRIAQLKMVGSLVEALEKIINAANGTITFSLLSQWAQSLYESTDYRQYSAQTDSRLVIENGACMISPAKKTVWCDFYGDVTSVLSTGFLSPLEITSLTDAGVRLWNVENEKKYKNFMMSVPLLMTEDKISFVVCKKQGENVLPTHPMRLQLPQNVKVVDGDKLYEGMCTKDVEIVDNHRESDAREIVFDATKHHVIWRNTESYSALEVLLQNPLDYVMNYILGFTDKGPAEIKMSLTRGNVAHETIEMLLTNGKDSNDLRQYVKNNYEDAFKEALVKKGALLLLPENHFECDKLKHQLRRCVNKIADFIQTNGFTLEACEQRELEDLEFEHGVKILGFIDLLLKDTAGKYVVLDLKWTSKKDKFSKLLKDNRAAQLAIYKAMLRTQYNLSDGESPRTAFFVMPAGKIVTTDDFASGEYDKVEPKTVVDIVDQLRKGYDVRRKEISGGKIETSEGLPAAELDYYNEVGVFPLETEGKKDPKKVENKYSDYKCFTM